MFSAEIGQARFRMEGGRAKRSRVGGNGHGVPRRDPTLPSPKTGREKKRNGRCCYEFRKGDSLPQSNIAVPAAGRLAENIVYFARALRAAGIPVGPGAVLDALAAVKVAGVGERADFYWTLHAVFVKKHEHSVLFDQAFRIFFRRRGTLDRLMAMMMPQAPGAAQKPLAGSARVE